MKKKSAYTVTLDCRNPESHRLQITIEAGEKNLPQELVFPVWTPGSYMVREYSRHVTCLEPAQKISKNTWRLNGSPKKVSYEVYAHERTVRTSFLDAHYAALVGASLLPLLQGNFTVRLLVPKSWTFVSSALNFTKQSPGVFTAQARDDDHWIDSPIVSAAPGYGAVSQFRCKGITHHIAWVGMECARTMKEMERDFYKIAETVIAMFGRAPFQEYWFLLHFGNKLYGGLEHRDSQLSQFDGASIAESQDYDAFLRLIAHEYFHSWNVKAIRPRALGPFDYTQENYTEDLWFAEGLTDYFDDIIPLEAGLIDTKAYAKARLKDVQGMADGFPGHTRRSVGESSFDAWIRYYRPDEDSINSDVSYYGKGALLGWCWDALLQKKSKGKWTLSRLMKEIYQEFGVDAYVPLAQARPGFTREELLEFAEKRSKVAQAKEVEAWVTQRKPLPWREAADFFGLAYEEKVQDLFFHQSGAQLQWKNGSCSVGKVLSGSSAEKAGLAAGDEILGLNGFRTLEQNRFLWELKKLLKAGSKAEIHFTRLDKIKNTKLVLKPHKGVGLEIASK